MPVAGFEICNKPIYIKCVQIYKLSFICVKFNITSNFVINNNVAETVELKINLHGADLAFNEGLRQWSRDVKCLFYL